MKKPVSKHGRYLALLRGINVGGKHIIKMAELKACFEDMGFADVSTFIQSGNVLFTTTKKNVGKLCNEIEKALSRKFQYASRIVLISQRQLAEVVKKAPRGFGTRPSLYRYDVIFLKPPLTAKEAMKSIPVNPKVDQAFAGKEVLYFSRLTSKATQSRLSRIIQLLMYKSMTIRNWNTTSKLLALMEASS